MASGPLMCNAGVNAVSVLPDGSMNVCFDRKNQNLGNVFTGFEFKRALQPCDKVHCSCPLWAFEKDLHAKAKGEPFTPRPYDVFMHWHVTYECQMMCNYCIVTGPDKLSDTRDKKRASKPIDIPALVRNLDQSGLTYMISFMGGEPFLVPNIVDACAELTKKHFIGFNTNLTAMPDDFIEKINLEKLSHMHISLHIHPMEKKGLTETFIHKAKILQRSGFERYYMTVVAHPAIFPKLEYYVSDFREHGIRFKLIPMLEGGFSTNGKVYPDSYTAEELKLIDQGWLDDYFPQKNARGEKPVIGEFRPRNPENREHSFRENPLQKLLDRISNWRIN